MTLQNPEAESKPKRAQLKHALFDVDFNSKPKVKTLRIKFGQLARLWYFDLTLDISAATNAQVDRALAVETAREIGIENFEQVVDWCIENGLLYEEDGKITSIRVAEDQEKLWRTQERWRRSKEGDGEDSVEIPRGSREERARKSESIEVLKNNEPLNSNKKNSEPLQKYGDKYLQMTQAEWGELCNDFGEPLARQELKNADIWLDKAETPNARKFRKPGKNHYLFYRSWLNRQSLKATSPNKPSAAQRNQQTTFDAVQSILEEERDRGNI